MKTMITGIRPTGTMFSFLWHILSKRKMWYKIIVPKF